MLGSSIQGYDCAGLNAVSYGLICQELERGDSGIRSFVSVQSSLCMYPIYAFGSEEQKQRWLPDMARGRKIGCFGLTEPHGGSDPSNMKTRAEKKGGDWVINGSKMWITNGAIADLCICWAMTDDGIRGFIVEKGMKGFAAPEIERKFSLRASVTSSLFFDNVVVPEANLLPGVKGLKGPLSCLTQARYGITWGVIGAAQACLSQLIDYTKTREMFGTPAGRDAGHPAAARRDGAQDHHRPVAVPSARPPQGSGHDAAGRRCRWRSGTTAAWRSTSRAIAATCSAARASAPNTCRSATRSISRA